MGAVLNVRVPRRFAPVASLLSLLLVAIVLLWQVPPAGAQAQYLLRHAGDSSSTEGGSGESGSEGAGSGGGGTTIVPADSAEAQEILERARASGATILVLQPPAGAAASGPGLVADVGEWQRLAAKLRNRALELAADAPNLPAQVDEAMERSGGFATLGVALAALIVALLVGYVVDWLIGRRWLEPQLAALFGRIPRSRAERVGFLLTRGFIRVVRVLVQVLVAAGLIIAVQPGGHVVEQVALSGIVLFALAGIGDAFLRNMLAIDVPEYRMVSIGAEDAALLYRDFRILLWLAMGLIWIAKAGLPLGLPAGAGLLLMSGAASIAAIICIWLTLRHRRRIAAMLQGPVPRGSRTVRTLAQLWYVPAVIYLVFAWFATGARLLLGSQQPLQLLTLPLLALFAALVLYGVLLVLADLAFRTPRTALPPEAIPPGEGPELLAQVGPSGGGSPGGGPVESLGEGLGEGEVMVTPSAPPPPRDSSYARLAERAAGWIAFMAGLAVLMHGWQLNRELFGHFWGSFWEIVLVVFLAWLAYEAVRIAVDRRLAEEAGGAGDPHQEEEGPRRGLSRLGTLLPMFRTFLLLTILVFAGMVILSAVGVDVTPLFAGAGVIGLAIGFGAQTLIRDIFSGAFFLIDDAFRVGEYVNVGPVKGTVERVSIRSMQLRHQLGPLHTIPFGEIKHLQNYSRDWVVMKLPLRLTYDTDVEEVRKIIKKIGQELLENPEIGDKFLQPLKSQGVFQMEDSAMIIRVKFMTRPGDQFAVRKVVYARIREVFAEKGIRFAHRQVTVRLADDRDADPEEPGQPGQRRPLTPAEQQAVAGAALAAVAEEYEQRKSGENPEDAR